MEYNHPSNELVNTTYNLIKESYHPSMGMWYELDKLIELEVVPINNFNILKNDFFEKYETQIKEMINEKTIEDNIFNLQRYTLKNALYDKFFFNDGIKLEEKQNLINLHAIRPDFYFYKETKKISLDELKENLELSPIEDIFEFYKFYETKRNKDYINLIKAYKPEITSLLEKAIESSSDVEEQKGNFHVFLFESYGHVSSEYSFVNREYNILKMNFNFYQNLSDAKLYDEYNVKFEKTELYNKFKSLEKGSSKDIDAYCRWAGIIYESPSSRKTRIRNLSNDICKRLLAQYPVEKITEIIKNFNDSQNIPKEDTKIIKNFIKGYKNVYGEHCGESYLSLYTPYFDAISKTDNFKEIEKRYFGEKYDHLNIFLSQTESLMEKTSNRNDFEER